MGCSTPASWRSCEDVLFGAIGLAAKVHPIARLESRSHSEDGELLSMRALSAPVIAVAALIATTTAATKHPKVLKWLARHPRWVFHFTPTAGSWLNAVETFFSALTRRRIRRGSFHSIVDLQAAINRYIAEHNADPKPCT